MINYFEKFHLKTERMQQLQQEEKIDYLTSCGSQQFKHIEMFPLAINVSFFSLVLSILVVVVSRRLISFYRLFGMSFSTTNENFMISISLTFWWSNKYARFIGLKVRLTSTLRYSLIAKMSKA